MELGSDQEDTNSEESWSRTYKKIKKLSKSEINATQHFSNVDCDKPSTSGTSIKVLKEIESSPSKMKKRNVITNGVLKEPSRAKRKKGATRVKAVEKNVEHQNSTPCTRKYAKMTTKELTNLAKRISIFHKTGIVVLEGTEDDKTYSKKRSRKKPSAVTERSGKQIYNTRLAKNLLNNDTSSCFTFGIENCNCCPKSQSLNLDEHTDAMDVDHLSISQIQPDDVNPGVDDSEENVDDIDSQNSVKLYGLPSLTFPKHKLIEKFFDSFTHDRVDYCKPEQKNIVEGLIHNPVSYYSEYLCDDVDSPEKTILERIDFQKEQERLARLSLIMNKPSTSTQNPKNVSLKDFESVTTSTPKPILNAVSFKTELSPIQGESSNDSPGKPTENIEPTNDCDNAQAAVAKVVEVDKEHPAENGLSEVVDTFLNLNFSHIDTSFVTIRTPLKPRNHAIIDEKVESEDSIMDFVNNMLATDEEAIVQECQMRCQRLLESRQNTNRAIASTLEAIEVLDDDDMLDTSVQIIENSIESLSEDRNSDLSVQFVDVNRISLCDSDIQIIDAPSSELQPKTETIKEEPQNVNAPSNSKISDCSICFEPLLQAKDVSSTTCGHVYCTDCIKKSIKTFKKCPMCRTHLTLKKIHPLFLF